MNMYIYYVKRPMRGEDCRLSCKDPKMKKKTVPISKKKNENVYKDVAM